MAHRTIHHYLAAAGMALAVLALPLHAAQDPDEAAILKAMANTSTWGHPDLAGQFAGMRYHAKGDYQSALKYFESGARYADKLSQLSIGLMHLNGEGVPQDPVAAYAWIAIAAERGYPRFVGTRDNLWRALSESQREQAKAAAGKLQAEYGDAVAKPRMAKELNYWRTQITGSRTGFNSGVRHLDVGMVDGTGTSRSDCGGATVGGDAATGCGDIYADWRWKPELYFKSVDAQWTGTVTVGNLESVPAAPAGAASGSAPAQPAGTP